MLIEWCIREKRVDFSWIFARKQKWKFIECIESGTLPDDWLICFVSIDVMVNAIIRIFPYTFWIYICAYIILLWKLNRIAVFVRKTWCIIVVKEILFLNAKDNRVVISQLFYLFIWLYKKEYSIINNTSRNFSFKN